MNGLATGSGCFGCGACAAVCPTGAIAMTSDAKGFLYPSVSPDKCVSCGCCASTCQKVHAPVEHGAETPAFAAQHHSKDVLLQSSSGGAFVALSDVVLAQGGMVAGAVFDPASRKVVHLLASDRAGRNRMCGSKYVQSDTSAVWKEIKQALQNGKSVLFTGTPCQVAALQAVLSNTSTDQLISVDILCHGAPSPLVFAAWIDCLEKRHASTVTDYQFRSKIYGYEYTHSVSFANGDREHSLETKRILKLYTLNMRDSCHECPFASRHRVGDLTIGDLWRRPKSIKVKPHIGCSTVIVNTEKGRALLDRAAHDLDLIPLELQPGKRQALSRPVERKPRVDGFWTLFEEKGIEAVMDRYAKISLKSRAFFALLKVLHALGMESCIETIKRHFET